MNLRKLLLIIPGLVVFVALGAIMAQPAGTAQADNGIHMEGSGGATPDGCASCHRAHRGINDMLLVDQVEAMCLSCHGVSADGSVLNVTAGTNESTTGALRAGGYGTARIDTEDPTRRIYGPTGRNDPAEADADCWNGLDDDGDTVADDGCPRTIAALAAPGETVRSKHSTNGSLQIVWGNGPIDSVVPGTPGLADYPLTCVSCHDPHGNGSYRILKEEPDGSGGAGYAIPDTYPKDEDTAGHYDTTDYLDMTFTGDYATDNILKDTSAWCSQCHTRYLATRYAALPADASRVDSGDLIFKYRHTSSGEGWNSSRTTLSKNNRACITCHATHGSNATAGTYSGAVPLPDGYAGAGLADSRLLKMDNRGICRKCHTQ